MMQARRRTRWTEGPLLGCPPYLLPHVDEEELPGNIEGHVGVIGIVAEVGDGDVYGDILHSPQSQIWGFLINAAMKKEQP